MIRARWARLLVLVACGETTRGTSASGEVESPREEVATAQASGDATRPVAPGGASDGEAVPTSPRTPAVQTPVDRTPTVQKITVAPPEGLVDLRERLPQLAFSIGYATNDNFTGAPLAGYEAPGAWAHPDVADALAKVDAVLAADAFGLLVFDAYRPRRATRAMVRWARDSGRANLLRDGYIAERSQHNRGLAIDLTLTDRTTGAPLEMGGAWDTFDRSAAPFAAKGDADTRRRALRTAMLEAGFTPHEGEWWHFSLRRPAAREHDVPYTPAPAR